MTCEMLEEDSYIYCTYKPIYMHVYIYTYIYIYIHIYTYISLQVAARLRGAGMTCKIVEEDSFRASMFEKHMWISAFMLLGVHHKGTVGHVFVRDMTLIDT